MKLGSGNLLQITVLVFCNLIYLTLYPFTLLGSYYIPSHTSNSITFVKFTPAMLLYHLIKATMPFLVLIVLLICFSNVEGSFFYVSFHFFPILP